MKILMLTSIYPIPDVKITGSTSVCHYFAKEWIKQGHEVRVINTYTIYPRIFHWLSRILEQTIANKFPVSINKARFSKPIEYKIDGVDVLLSPTFKKIPMADFGTAAIRHTADNIVQYLINNDFTPDIITSHFINPNIELLPELKKSFPNVPCGINLHGKINSPQSAKRIRTNKEKIDFWGFRSYPIYWSFDKMCFEPINKLYCFSGVPESYINLDSYKKHYKSGVDSFIFVGNLNYRKHPITVLEALIETNQDFSLAFVGTGKQGDIISNIVSKRKLESHVKLEGRKSREEVAKKMLDTECFIMVSEDETFGLVYLEAMANGCVVIASKNEGMDGIIKHGINGFLCEAGNKAELTKLINHIRSMSPDDKIRITKAAIQTAANMTDSKVAKKYSESLNQISKLYNVDIQ